MNGTRVARVAHRATPPTWSEAWSPCRAIARPRRGAQAAHVRSPAQDGALAKPQANGRNTRHLWAKGLAIRGHWRKSWDLAFHFFRRVDWSHKVTSYSELFRCAGQVRTPVSEWI